MVIYLCLACWRVAADLKLSGLKKLGWGTVSPYPNFLRPESYRSAAS